MSVEVNNESGVPVDEQRLVALALFALDALRIHPQAELSVLLVDEPTMAAYHEKYMDEPGPTDVLSFPMDELRPPRDGEEPPLGMLGDIVLCPTVTAAQAADSNRTVIEQAPVSVSRLSILYFMPFGKPGRVIFLKSTSRSTKGSICGRAIAVVLPEGWRC